MPERAQIERLKQRLIDADQAVELCVNPGDGRHPLVAELQDLAQALAACSPMLRLSQKACESELPELQITRAGLATIVYAGLPNGNEWEPFAQALTIATGAEPLSFVGEGLPASAAPRVIETTVMPGCVHCPQAVALLNRLALMTPGVVHRVVDAAQFLERARKLGIMATPTIRIDGRKLWTGALSESDAYALMMAAGGQPENLVAAWIKAGQLTPIISVLGEDPLVAQSLAELLGRTEIGLHLGVLRVIEEVSEQDAGPLAAAVPVLIELCRHPSAQSRGDAAYALGMIGDSSAVAPLQALADSDPDEDVRDGAKDALRQIDKRP